MRPQKQQYLIQKFIDNWLQGVLPSNPVHFKQLCKAVDSRVEYHFKDENTPYYDYETFIPYPRIENIVRFFSPYYEMMYISDRWECYHRLKWIQDGSKFGWLLDKDNMGEP